MTRIAQLFLSTDESISKIGLVTNEASSSPRRSAAAIWGILGCSGGAVTFLSVTMDKTVTHGPARVVKKRKTA
jgi:hypothetical protein